MTRGNVVCDQAVIADRPRGRMRGLLGRKSLPAGEGMLLQPAPSIHTAFMRFPIDVVFTDGTLRVVKTIERLRPWRVASARRAWAVLELATDQIARSGIEVGDQLGLLDLDGAVTQRLGRTGWMDSANGSHLFSQTPGDPSADARGANSGFGTGDGPRVLLVGNDRRFRYVAAALLTRRGCAVMIDDRRRGTAQLAHRAGADVVVLDAGPSLTAAARETAQLEALDPPVGAVLVGDDPVEELFAMPVLPKWGSFDSLYRAITDARPRDHRDSCDVPG